MLEAISKRNPPAEVIPNNDPPARQCWGSLQALGLLNGYGLRADALSDELRLGTLDLFKTLSRLEGVGL